MSHNGRTKLQFKLIYDTFYETIFDLIFLIVRIVGFGVVVFAFLFAVESLDAHNDFAFRRTCGKVFSEFGESASNSFFVNLAYFAAY